MDVAEPGRVTPKRLAAALVHGGAEIDEKDARDSSGYKEDRCRRKVMAHS
jgi:hypothetical protein